MSVLDADFADMPKGERQYWLNWANSHDWGGGRDAHYEGDKLVTSGEEHNEATGWTVQRAYHSTPREMRNWAGY